MKMNYAQFMDFLIPWRLSHYLWGISFSPFLNEEDLSFSACKILLLIEEEKIESTESNIYRHSLEEPSHTNLAISSLTDKNLIVRLLQDDDQYYLALTEQGRALLVRLHEYGLKMINGAFAEVTQEEIQTTIKVVTVLQDRLMEVTGTNAEGLVSQF